MSAKSTGKRSRPAKAKVSPKTATNTPSRGRANLAKLRRVSEAEIRRTSPPELADLPDDFWDAAVVVLPETKVPISLR